MNAKGFMLFVDQREYIDLLDAEQKAVLLDALYAFASGEPVGISDKMTQLAFAAIRKGIEQQWGKSEKMRANAKSKTKQNEAKVSKREQKLANVSKIEQNEAKPSNAEVCSNDPKEKERSKEKENSGVINQDLFTPLPLRGDPQGGSARQKKAKPAKKTYGEFGKVLLTDDEYAKLCEHFGGAFYAGQWIARLDDYIASKGDKYKSHYATILNWERGDGDDRKQSASTVPRQGYLSDAERRMQQNKAVCRQVSAELDAIDSPF